MFKELKERLAESRATWKKVNSPAYLALLDEAVYDWYQDLIRDGKAIRPSPSDSDSKLAQIAKDFEEMLAHPLARKYLKQRPELVIVEDDHIKWDQRMNALVKCPNVVQVSRGLVENMEPSELKFHIGHELGHLIRGDQHPRNTVLMTSIAAKLNQRSERMADQLGVVLSGVGADCAQSAMKKVVALYSNVVEEGLSELPGTIKSYIVGSLIKGSRTYPSLQGRLNLVARTAAESEKDPEWVNRVLQGRLDALHEKLR
jgi:Zn-dependent protease with chaperone function